MTTKHTPGPWEPWNNFGSRHLKSWRIGTRSVAAGIVTPVAVVDDSIPGDEQVANARLIAASPDMHAALTVIIDRLEAWAEHSERIARTEADSPRTEQHKNIAANYRELIRIARDSMPKS